MVAAALLGVGVSRAPQAKAANLYWDSDATSGGNNISTGAGLGGAGTWDTSSAKWFDGTNDIAWSNSALDVAYFTGTAGTVALGGPITVGGLNFGVTGYTLSGNTLTLSPPTGSASPAITVTNNGRWTNRATISSALAGTSGFTKTGNGTLVLTADNSAGLSGDIAIKGGSLVITAANQLGAATGSAISVTGWSTRGNPGYSGGALVLQGTSSGAGSTSGINLSREVTISGRGPGMNNDSGALISIGYNTLAGGLTSGHGIGETRFWGTHGATTISGPLKIGAGGISYFYGNGNFIVSGVVGGAENSSDRFYKTGNIIGSTLWLQNVNNSFAQAVRVDSGTVRVQSNSALGKSILVNAVDLVNGWLEVRTDAPTSFAARNVRVRNNTTLSVIFVDRDVTGPLGIGGSLINQTVTFGTLLREAGNAGATITFAGRNGYGVSGSTTGLTAGDYRGYTLTNSSSGTVTINGNPFNHNNTNVMTFTVGGNAETIINGSVLASTTAAHVFTKSGTGTLIYAGTAGTYSGATNISAGTLSFSNVGGFANTSGILIGNATTTSGALTYTGPTATLNRPITINTTTPAAPAP
jgi:autotransporter-associated beta strand protein